MKLNNVSNNKKKMTLKTGEERRISIPTLFDTEPTSDEFLNKPKEISV